MNLFTLLLVASCQISIISACPKLIVIKNVNWDNVPEGHWLHGVDIETINGNKESKLSNN